MAFWIDEKAGIAYESTEGSRAKWTSEDKEFNVFMSLGKRRRFKYPRKRCSIEFVHNGGD